MSTTERARWGLVVLALLALVAPTAAATVVTVTDCGDAPAGGAPGQLRRLINDASEGDTILVPAGCTIVLTGAANEDANQHGDLDIVKGLNIIGAGSSLSAIDGGGNDRVFDLLALGHNVTIAGLTVRNGNIAAITDSGGGILVRSGFLLLHDVHVTDNVAVGGAGGGGGGIWNSGTMIMAFSAVTGNRGGGIFNDGDLTVNTSTISGNTSAIAMAGGLHTQATAMSSPGNATLTNVTISGNSTNGHGGGIRAAGLSVTLRSVTITGNAAAAGGGGISGFTTTTLRNAIVAGNGVGGDCEGSLVSAGHNLDGDSSCPFTQPTDRPGRDPRLGPLARLGGFNDSHALGPGSPAVDAGDLAACPGTDQRAVRRPLDGDGDGVAACDIGAVEQFRFAGAVDIALNQASYAAGDLLSMDLSVTSPGPSAPVDAYLGFVLPPAAGPGLGCPAGDAAAFVTAGFAGVEFHCLSDPPSGFPRLAEATLLPASLPPTRVAGLFSGRVPAAPAGDYLAFFAFTVPNALVDNTLDPGELLAADTAGFAVH